MSDADPVDRQLASSARCSRTVEPAEARETVDERSFERNDDEGALIGDDARDTERGAEFGADCWLVEGVGVPGGECITPTPTQTRARWGELRDKGRGRWHDQSA